MIRNKKQDNKKKSDNSEILGVILIMVSAFFLVSLIVGRWIFGDIGEAVVNVTIGLFGFTAYPIFFTMFFIGIAMLKRLKPEANVRYVGGIVAITVFAVLIMQLAMTYSHLSDIYGDYVSYVFNNFTAGGLIFGTLAFAVQAIVTPSFAFVVFALGILFTALFMSWDKIKKMKSADKKAQEKASKLEIKPQEKGSQFAVNRINRTHAQGLYVDKIIPKNDNFNPNQPQYINENNGYIESGYGSFENMKESKSANGLSRYSDNAKASEIYSGTEVESSAKRTRARNILEEAKAAHPFALNQGYSTQSSASGLDKATSNPTPILPPLITSIPDIKTVGEAGKRPSKTINIEDTGLQNVVVPPPKDIDDQIVGGHIINGDELSKHIAQMQETNISSKDKTASTSTVNSSLGGVFIPEKPIENFDNFERPPILNGDYFNRSQENSEPVKDNFASQSNENSIQNDVKTVQNDAKNAQKHVENDAKNVQKRVENDAKLTENESQNTLSIDLSTQDSAYKRFGIPEIFIPSNQTERPAAVISNSIINGEIFEYKEEKDYFETDKSYQNNELRAGSAFKNFSEPEFKDVSDFAADIASKQNIEKESRKNTSQAQHSINQESNQNIAFESESSSEYNSFKDFFNAIRPKINEKTEDNSETAKKEEIEARKKEEEARNRAQEEARRRHENERILDDDDEVEDLTAKGYDNPNDSTGYYNAVDESDKKVGTGYNTLYGDSKKANAGYKAPVGFGTQSQPAPKLKPENQIKLDDYARTVAPPVKQKLKRRNERYNPPPIDFLISSKINSSEATEADSNEKARLLESTLSELKLPATVNAITRGPTVTRYELEMPPGIPIKRIEQFAKDIEYSLAIKGKIRIETPIPGKRAVGIEIPNDVVDIVRLREIITSKEFVNSVSPATLALGKDIAGSVIVCQLEKMPHLLIAGQTGSGKSACLNSIIMSILYKATPDDVRIILIDPKRVEFTIYRDMPHLLTGEIITESVQTLNALKWLKVEMERRYTLFSLNVVRNLSEYNKLDGVKSGEMEKLPVLILVIDEMADLMLSDNRKDLEERIMNLAAKSRAAGIHLILATQRPSVDVITGTIKANLPSCIAFAVKSVIDSRTILDSAGAEALLGNGDMIYAPAGNDFTRRVQGAYVTNEEVSEVVNYVRDNNTSDFDDDFKNALSQKEEASDSAIGGESDFDVLVPEVLKLAIAAGQISATFIQQRFSVGYPRASKIMYQLEKNNFISPNEGNNKPRTVFLTRERYTELFNEEI